MSVKEDKNNKTINEDTIIEVTEEEKVTENLDQNDIVTEIVDDEKIEISLKEYNDLKSVSDSYKELSLQLDELKIEFDKQTEDMLFVKSEVKNTLDRSNRETANKIKFANTKILQDFITIIEEFDLALSHVPEVVENKETQNFIAGIKNIHSNFIKILEKHNITRLDESEVGKDVDLNKHEIIATFNSPDIESGKIAAVTRFGYILEGRTIRAAQVAIAA